MCSINCLDERTSAYRLAKAAKKFDRGSVDGPNHVSLPFERSFDFNNDRRVRRVQFISRIPPFRSFFFWTVASNGFHNRRNNSGLRSIHTCSQSCAIVGVDRVVRNGHDLSVSGSPEAAHEITL